jgi:hypothetical protein
MKIKKKENVMENLLSHIRFKLKGRTITRAEGDAMCLAIMHHIDENDINRKCEKCRWFVDESEDGCDDIGVCHRYPPSNTETEGAFRGMAGACMYVYRDHWCGEFKKKEH